MTEKKIKADSPITISNEPTRIKGTKKGPKTLTIRSESGFSSSSSKRLLIVQVTNYSVYSIDFNGESHSVGGVNWYMNISPHNVRVEPGNNGTVVNFYSNDPQRGFEKVPFNDKVRRHKPHEPIQAIELQIDGHSVRCDPGPCTTATIHYRTP